MNNATPADGHVILIDKPLEWTSFDVVKKLKYKLKLKKVGHAGTLDPLATGLLILCTDKKTKQISSIQEQPKEYTGTLVLGKTTASYDLESPIIQGGNTSDLTEDFLFSLIPQFEGEIEQTPPIFSAVKIRGERAYKKARAGEKVELKSRIISIYNFEITSINLPKVNFKVNCSKGTYIRSLVNDFGQAAGVGAYLSKLRRTKIGDYSVNDAFTIDSISSESL
ncbi:tRNA pseudouridine(55) synthase [hydrothermal vent metagenome]|uniref:tRNA pseudouridine(55) synthase n=1 Tax=hydrothermal vent metagenome TaxID=652676 RepID=A0A3B0U527_9ZZZZ